MLKITSAALLATLLTACGTSPTTAARPDKFAKVHDGRYPIAQQAQLVDCVFDGFLAAQSLAMATHVRQTKRANGYRIDVIAGPVQYLVADVRDDGSYELIRSSYAGMVPLAKEEDASRACMLKFSA